MRGTSLGIPRRKLGVLIHLPRGLVCFFFFSGDDTLDIFMLRNFLLSSHTFMLVVEYLTAFV